jgi:hypothetical protein
MGEKMTPKPIEPEGNEKLPALMFLNETFLCDPDDGKLFWKIRPDVHFANEASAKRWNKRNSGKEAGSKDHGYRRVSIRRSFFYVHRIIWKMATEMEPDVIDHINGDGMDNRLNNLRSCSQKENCRNQNRLAESGVYKCRDYGWYGQVPVGEKTISKLFKTKDEAVLWRRNSALSLGFTERHLGIKQ